MNGINEANIHLMIQNGSLKLSDYMEYMRDNNLGIKIKESELINKKLLLIK